MTASHHLMALLSHATRIRHNYLLQDCCCLFFLCTPLYFSTKMSIADPKRAIPAVLTLTKAALGNITTTKEEVLQQLKQVDPKKALGPDKISPHILKRCATQLATPLASIFHGVPFISAVANSMESTKSLRHP